MKTKLNLNVPAPASCKIPISGDLGHNRAIAVEYALEEMTNAGVEMSDDELVAAHNEMQPHLDKIRRFLCWGCHLDCPFVMNLDERRAVERRQTLTLRSLGDGNSAERDERAKLYLLQLLPEPTRQQLVERGIEVNPIHWGSRKNPRICIVIRKEGTVTHQIIASSQTIQVNGDSRPFDEFSLKLEVNKVVRALMAA